jgi:hypothetical protein
MTIVGFVEQLRAEGCKVAVRAVRMPGGGGAHCVRVLHNGAFVDFLVDGVGVRSARLPPQRTARHTGSN